MLVAGGISLARRSHRPKSTPSANYHLGLALLALVGGGVLFTHVHSVAPYSNRAIGVYLHHLTMGLIALSIGTVSFWEALQPVGFRWRSYLWPSILLIESVLLICYNEDIPWFVKYFTNDSTHALINSRYDLQVETNPSSPAANQECELRFILALRYS